MFVAPYRFIGGWLVALATVGTLVAPAAASPSDYVSRWEQAHDRFWIGPEYWANRLQDWRLHEGRLECIGGGVNLPVRTVHLLTHRLSEQPGAFEAHVTFGFAEKPQPNQPAAFAGLLFGAGGRGVDYRSAAILQSNAGPGGGVIAAVDSAGAVSFRDFEQGPQAKFGAEGEAPANRPAELTLRVIGQPGDDGQFIVRADVLNPATGRVLSSAVAGVPAERMIGGVAIVSHPGGAPRPMAGNLPGARHYFTRFTLSGSKLDVDTSRMFGPIACTQYTLSRGVLKMTAQLLPTGRGDDAQVWLETGGEGQWKRIATADVIVPGHTATFRVPEWNDKVDTPYRVACRLTTRDGEETAYWAGTVRRDPVDKNEIVVAGFTGNHMTAHRLGDWKQGVWFPHNDITRHVASRQADVLFFSGDQIYEGASPTPPDRPNIMLDYLYKWYLWCWSYRDLTRDIATITMPDDHDVFQGNLWGEGGRATDKDDKGGYVHPAEFVKMVERTQTSHLPDPFDPTPVEQGIGVYYSHLVYGRISFAILEDRKFKSGCNGRVPPSGSNRADHITDPDFDVRRADVPGVHLLGERQEHFLAEWARDWRGADMKMAVSQTVFAGLATHHGQRLEYLRADLDSNGWPQSGRNRAIDLLRRAHAFHLGGDQHLATIAHHGIETHGDAIWSLCVPSTANFYPRAWSPKNTGAYKRPNVEDFTGDFTDGLGNLVTVYAATNPDPVEGRPRTIDEGMPGYGLVRLDKTARTITMECWPRSAAPDDPAARQYEGWPKTIRQTDNYARRPTAYLPKLAANVDNPLVEVLTEPAGELVYALRIAGREFQPHVFAAGKYTVVVSDPDRGVVRMLPGLAAAAARPAAVIEVNLSDK